MNPKDGETRYNLVCAYALLEQPDNALRHLRICLDNDPNRIFYNTAASDPDLWSLRRTAEYYNIFKAHPNPEPLGKPRLSER
jgi:hypothetical protein